MFVSENINFERESTSKGLRNTTTVLLCSLNVSALVCSVSILYGILCACTYTTTEESRLEVFCRDKSN